MALFLHHSLNGKNDQAFEKQVTPKHWDYGNKWNIEMES